MKNRLILQLRQAGFINTYNDKIVETGLEYLLENITLWLFVSIVSAWFGNILIGIVFEINYLSLRIYAGGYHSKSKYGCTVLTYISVVICLFLCFYVRLSVKEMCILLYAAINIIMIIVPVESKNKRLNHIEFKVFQRKARVIITTEGIICLGCMTAANNAIYAQAIVISICFNLISLLVAKIIQIQE